MHPLRVQEVAHVDFGDDRVVGLALHSKEKMCVVTTSGGAAHGCVYTDKELKKVFSATTAQAAADGEYPNQRAVAISPKGNEVAMGLGHKIALWKLGKNEKGLCDQKVLEAVHTDAVKEIIFTDDAKAMVSIDDGACVVWELPSGKQVRKGVAGAGGKCPGKLRGLALGAEGSKRLYTCVNSRDGGFVQERDMADKNLKILRSKQVSSNMITAMSCRPAGQWLSVGDSEGNVILWNMDTMSRAIEAEVHVMAVSKVCVCLYNVSHYIFSRSSILSSWMRVSVRLCLYVTLYALSVCMMVEGFPPH